jgi:L-asparaginase II
MSVPLTGVYRGTLLESIHRGSIAVVDSTGKLLAYAGDPGAVTSLRSAAKPFQAIPLLEYGGAAEFDLTGEEIALTCGSHGGEPVHVATAAALLRKGELDEEDLLCGAHDPFDEKASADLRASGEAASPLHNNCSGKHAGMLLATQVMDVPDSGYIESGHPLQILMRSTLADFAAVDAGRIPHAVDGCGVPAFFLPLYRAAYAYARLMATAQRQGAPGSLERYMESAASIVESIAGFPHYVAGNWSMTTPLIAGFEGELVGKDGAEGFYAIALSPRLSGELTDSLGVADDAAVGIALKIEDGSMDRGRNPAILRLLDLLGLGISARPALEAWRRPVLRNHAGTVVGEARAEFGLEVL